MKSPFPGMDPYLESKWPEVHARLIVYASNQINGKLPRDLQANIEENVGVYDNEEFGRSIRPDLHVSEDTAIETEASVVVAGAIDVQVAAKPMIVKRPPHPTRHIEILDSDGRLVTAIEFISPWNKVGIVNRENYTRKQRDYLDANVNLVEIDLVRQGAYVLAAPLSEIPEDERSAYMMCVFRRTKPDRFEVYRGPIQSVLPNIPIPLRPNESDLVLELQPLIDACYRDGRYDRINYQAPPKAKFSQEDTAWMEARLRVQGKR
ncbi:MAG: DUF4058 family protein [Pirellula sp.]